MAKGNGPRLGVGAIVGGEECCFLASGRSFWED